VIKVKKLGGGIKKFNQLCWKKKERGGSEKKRLFFISTG
jgi:hypothetical protein